MKYKYEFATETVEVECGENWAFILEDLDRQERNNNQRETRRHCSLDALDVDGNYIPCEINVEEEVSALLDNEKLRNAMQYLNARQKHLVEQYFFCGRTQIELANEEEVDKSAICRALTRALERMKKILI